MSKSPARGQRPPVELIPTDRAEMTGVMTSYGQGALRTASIYGLGFAALLPFALLSVAVTTRYLDIPDYGRLATLLAASALLTLVAGLGIVQGTIMLVYRTGDEGDDDGDGDDAIDVSDELWGIEDLNTDEKRRILGSGFVLALLVATAISAPVALLAPQASSFILGSSQHAGVVRWMALTVWSGAMWRMAHQIWRLERRPWLWLGFQSLRPLLGLVGTIIALAAGMGIAGPLVGISAGSIVASAMSMVASRRCWLFQPRVSDWKRIWRVGRRFVTMQLASTMQSHLAVLLLAALSSASSVGLFAIAQRVANIPGYFAHGFFLSWPMVDSSPIGMAARARKGRPAHAASVFTLLMLGSMGLLVAVSLGSTGILSVLAPGYGKAADLIPLVAAGELGHMAFRGIYRAVRFPKRRQWFVLYHFLWLIPYVIVAVLLLPIGPSWAIATATLVACVLCCAGYVRHDRRAPAPTPFQWGRLTVAALASAAIVVGVEFSPTGHWARLALVIAAFVIFPVVLVRLRVLSRQHVFMIAVILWGLVPRPLPRKRVAERLAMLPAHEREVLAVVLWDGLRADEAALELGVDRRVVLARVARALRHYEGERGDGLADVEIGRYLVDTGLAIERDALSRRLASRGVDPLELHRLREAMRAVRRLRRRRPRIATLGDPPPRLRRAPSLLAWR